MWFTAVSVCSNIGEALSYDFQLPFLCHSSVISMPPGWQLLHLHPPHFGSRAAPMLSLFHQSRNSLLAAVVLVSALNYFVSVSSWYFTAMALMDLAKCVSDVCSAISNSSKRSGCAPPMVFPNGPSHRTRSPITFTLCGASLPSRWLIRSSIHSGLCRSSRLVSGKNFLSCSGLIALCTWAISSKP